ncbi:uncharacterized protein LOC109722848 [Ananas comosus]|uniref:Uncharacterized protein LOC109722848 n=1 Tax=Ananas comosus TaxID=4615 RepID=A0A6P5GF63_ANACO|nr:uncharacterized protein LOC109722848 [Ananas comosus]
MSGLSLAVAPRSHPEPPAAAASSGPGKRPQQQQQQQQAVMGGVMGSLRVIELQLVAFIMVFSASGLVPLIDLLFPALATLYVAVLSRLAFPAHRGAGSAESAGDEEIFRGRGWFRGYVVVGTTVGLFLPLAYVLGGFARGDDHAVRSATPHLFLLSCQILTENVVGGLGIFSPPVRALVPMLYTVRRVFVVIDWVHDVWINKALPATATATANLQDVGWMWFGRSLAVANLVYFSVNLLVFLIPQFLPRAFEMYFKQRDGAETVAKAAEDKQAAKDNVRASTEDAGRTGKDHAPASKPDHSKKTE